MRQLLKEIVHSGLFAESPAESQALRILSGKPGVNPASISVSGGRVFAIRECDGADCMIIMSRNPQCFDGFFGERFSEFHGGLSCYLLAAPLDHANADALRKALPFTAPSVLEGRESFGSGDRIGGKAPATPAHIDAVRGSGLIPVLAQQSVRENQKTGRTFDDVLDDATWSVFRKGYRQAWGSDADHLKTLEDVGNAVRAGFTMFTLDPSDKIDSEADTCSDDVLSRKFERLFPADGEKDRFLARYEGKHGASRWDVVRSAVKHLGAVRHAVLAYRRIVELRGERSFNFEMSIDETSTPTSPLDHHIIAAELYNAGVRLFSLAPRFEGEFEKGIDYKGSLEGFRRSLETHVCLSRELGGYRLSLHSGSDKFSVYPMFGEITDGFFHVKTAGTSYLEAVKAAAAADMDLFGRIYTLSIDTFCENVKSYHISADIGNVPPISALNRDEAIRLITIDADVRQTLHIAFGVILREMGRELRDALAKNSGVYHRFLIEHIGKHISLLTGR